MSVSSRIRMQVVRSVAPEAEGSASTSTASTSAKLGSHTTGVADSGRWSTRRIAMYALFVALAMVTSFIEFPITPVTWLKYDPSGIVCLIAGFAYGPAAAAIVSVLGFVPHMFANPWGSLMAVLVALFLSVPAAFIYRKIRTRKGAAIGILVSVLNQVLTRSGRDEQATMTTLTGLVVVLMMVVQEISDLFNLVKNLFGL